MKTKLCLITLGLAIIFACSSTDPMDEINRLVKEEKIAEAKKAFNAYADESDDPIVKQEYIKFLYDRNQFHDFRRAAARHLQAFPDDKTVKNLEFKYYAKLATDAERQQNYELALDYIVKKLLSPDFQEFRKWERQQTVILKAWFDWAGTQDNPAQKKKEVLIKMKNLGFDNLGKSLSPEMWDQI